MSFELAALIISPSIVAAYALAQKRWELQRADLAEARTVMDNAALQVMRERDAVHSLLWAWDIGAPTEVNEAVDRANTVRIESRAVLARLKIRLGGEHEVTRRYQDILDLVQITCEGIVAALKRGEKYDSGTDDMFIATVAVQVDRFEAAAFRVARVQLPTPPVQTQSRAAPTPGGD